MNLGVIGAGAVGLTTAAAFCSLGHRVICVENDRPRRERLVDGEMPFYEPGLKELVGQSAGQGRLCFTGSIAEALRFATVVFICVGTPEDEGGGADLSQVKSVAEAVADELPGYRLLIEKSTVPIGTYRYLSGIIRNRAGRDAEFEVACIPEFLRQGNAVHDFFNPDRIIIGVAESRGRALIEELYRPFDCPKLWTDPGTAELVKHASNAFLALKISYANLLSDVSEATGADLGQLLEGVGGDPRIGHSFLHPGVGYGGSCLPKDMRAFTHLSAAAGVDAALLDEVQRINRRRPGQMVAKTLQVRNSLKGKPVTVWGLSFKPRTDDVRSAPSLEIVRQLLEAGARVTGHDPVAIERFQEAFGWRSNLDYCRDMYQAAAGSYAVLLLTEWDDYRNADLNRLRTVMAAPLIVDGRRVFDPPVMRSLGFEYAALGIADGWENRGG